MSKAARDSSPSTILSPLLYMFLLLPSASPAPPSSLLRGSSKAMDDGSDILEILRSPDNSFTCGFYKVGFNAYAFSVWFSNSANKTIVWSANRDRPVNGRGSRITWNRDGGMVLMDVDGTVVWSTNTSSTQADQAELMDSGNLVVKDPKGTVLWQSFDSPTDTLLPTQPITKNIRLVSSKAEGLLSSGYYNFYFDNDNVLRLIYDGPEISSIYWPNPDQPNVFLVGRTKYNSTRYGVLDETGQFLASDRLAFKASDAGSGIKRRLTLDYDGNLRLYSLNERNGTWSISWAALQKVCNVHGLCGRYGICVYKPGPQCSCPPGYEKSDPSDWSKGCRSKWSIHRDNSQQMKFAYLPNTDFWGYDLNYTPSISFRACRKLCRKDPHCNAFGYKPSGTGVCFTKGDLFNGRSYPGAGNNMFLKLPRIREASNISAPQVFKLNCSATETETETPVGSSYFYGTSGRKSKWAYLYGFASAIFAIEVLFIAFGWLFISRREQKPTSAEEGSKAIFSQFKRFTYKELERATGKFKEELGRGGSGTVYKGVLEDDDERVVAVKKLEDVIQGEEEFQVELSVIGRIYHMNLVRMWGFCSEGSHRLLVSEFVENGSLDKVLFDREDTTTSLPKWTERFKIAVGIAKGLAYLHHECLEWVIHCDVKPENILLDKDFVPKIADFGLAKLLNRGASGSNLSRIRGTRGYIAPEWASSLPITGKVDVYSYGVVLLELVKGLRVSDWVIDGEEEVEMVLRRSLGVLKERLGSGGVSWIADFVDSRLNGQFHHGQAAMLVEVAVSCLEEERSRRPTMDNVVRMLLSSSDDEHDSQDSSLE